MSRLEFLLRMMRDNPEKAAEEAYKELNDEITRSISKPWKFTCISCKLNFVEYGLPDIEPRSYREKLCYECIDILQKEKNG